MVSEIAVTVKDDERNLRKKFLTYETYTVDENDSVIKGCIEETIAEFGGTPDHVSVRISMEVG